MLVPTNNPHLLPSKATIFKLFLAGSTVGPIVDSLHNQCLLTYDFAPISFDIDSSSMSHLFASSSVVPPLLGIAYVVLGCILPRIIELIVNNIKTQSIDSGSFSMIGETSTTETQELKARAILAVSSTSAIIKLSEFLETHSGMTYHLFRSYPLLLDAKTNLMIMVLADVVQWVALDRTLIALLTGVLTAFGGPLSELPFIAAGFWHYNVDASDYLPLSQVSSNLDAIASNLFGDQYKELALSSITGPCYFAVTLDAIALARYFKQSGTET